MFYPSRLLVAHINEIVPIAYWDEDDGSPWVSAPYRWRVTLTVTPQAHGSHLTPTPFNYTAQDVTVGDWLSDLPVGRAVKVISVVSADETTLVAEVEDVDRYNIFTTASGIGEMSTDAFIFSLGDDGLPILGPASSTTILSQNMAWQLDQISRFRHRNLIKSYYRVEQEGHGFVIGDVIRLGSDGDYTRVDPTDASIMSAVGTVNTVGYPGANWFTFRPVGNVVETISPDLPGQPGDLIYLDASGNTTIKPSRWARPVYIQLDAPHKAIVLDRGLDAVGSLGYAPQIFVVSNMASLADHEDRVNPGDQALVEDAGNGEWKHMIRHSNNSWKLMVTEDASNTDAETRFIEMDHTSQPQALIATISSGIRVTSVVVRVIEIFDSSVSFSVGTLAQNSTLMTIDQVDLTSEGSYAVQPTSIFEGGDTDLFGFISMNGTTAGKLRVTVTYS